MERNIATRGDVTTEEAFLRALESEDPITALEIFEALCNTQYVVPDVLEILATALGWRLVSLIQRWIAFLFFRSKFVQIRTGSLLRKPPVPCADGK